MTNKPPIVAILTRDYCGLDKDYIYGLKKSDAKDNLKQIQTEINALAPSNHISLIPREFAETCEDFLQIIPCAVIIKGNKILTYTRKGSETRLHGKTSITVGGHVEIGDMNHAGFTISGQTLAGSTLSCLSRELVEEAGVTYKSAGDTQFYLHGFLHVRDTAVDRVHLGIVFLLQVPLSFEPTCDEETVDAKWLTLDRLFNEFTSSQLEAWTQVLLPTLGDICGP